MPIYNRFWIDPQTRQHNPRLLTENGPALEVEISVPDDYAAALINASIPVPQPQTGSALIDAGARFTAVDIKLLERLGSPTGKYSASGDAFWPARAGRVYVSHGLSGYRYSSTSANGGHREPVGALRSCRADWA